MIRCTANIEDDDFDAIKALAKQNSRSLAAQLGRIVNKFLHPEQREPVKPGNYLIVETDNFGGGYPDESFLFTKRSLSQGAARAIADICNEEWCIRGEGSRFWKVVPEGYELQPGFEP